MFLNDAKPLLKSKFAATFDGITDLWLRHKEKPNLFILMNLELLRPFIHMALHRYFTKSVTMMSVSLSFSFLLMVK